VWKLEGEKGGHMPDTALKSMAAQSDGECNIDSSGTTSRDFGCVLDTKRGNDNRRGGNLERSEKFTETRKSTEIAGGRYTGIPRE